MGSHALSLYSRRGVQCVLTHRNAAIEPSCGSTSAPSGIPASNNGLAAGESPLLGGSALPQATFHLEDGMGPTLNEENGAASISILAASIA